MSKALSGLKSAKDTEATMVVPKHEVLQRANQGPFLCGNCEYWDGKAKCKHPYIIEHYGPEVDVLDCCDFHSKNK